MKRALQIAVLCFVCAWPALAQIQTTTLTGTVYDQSGAARAGVNIYVVRTVKDGAVISAAPQVVATSAAGGAITLTVVRGSTVYLYSPDIPAYNKFGRAGVPFAIQNVASDTLENLTLLSSVMQAQGDTVAAGANGRPSRVAGNTTSTPKYYRQVGSSGIAGIPTWAQPLLTELGDVQITSPSNGQALKYNSSLGKWTNQADATGGGGGGSLTVQEVDGSPSVGSVSTLEFNQAQGLTVTDQTGGVARVGLSAVPFSAMAALTANRALASNGSGQVAASAVTDTELGYLSGVTSAIQTQLNGKAATSHTHAQADITNLTSDLAAKAPTSRAINTNSGLTGGGDLSADRTIGIAPGGVTNAMLAGSIAISKLSITGTPDGAKFLRDDGSWQTVPGGGGAVSSVFGRTGAVTAQANDYTWAQINKTTSSLADITTRSASDLSSGTLPDGRFPATLPAVSGANLTSLNASNLASGTVADGRLSTNVFFVDGSRAGNSGATTGDGFSFDGLSLTSGNLFRARVPSSGFTGSILKITDNAGSPATKFEIDETGKITTGAADASLLTSGTVTAARIQEVIALADLSDVSAKTGTGSTVVMQGSPSLTTPTIADFSNATHSHTNAAGGGTLSASAIASGTLPEARGGTNQSTYTTGDMLYASASNTLSKLGIGSNGQVLKISGGIPTWQNEGGGTSHAMLSATHTDTTAGTVARGDLITGQGASATWQRLAIGANNRVLFSDGTDASWSTVPNAALANSSLTVTAGAGLANGGSVSLGSSTTLDVGAGTGITVNANDVAINQAFTPTWTGLHAFNTGTTPGNVLLLDIAAIGSAGTRDSHNMIWRGRSDDGSAHLTEWRAFNDVTSNAGASTFTIQSRIDAAGFANRLTITDGGAVTATSFSGDGSALTSLNASNLGSGTVPLARLSGITTSQISGSAGITNAQLANSSITIGSTGVSLGGTAATVAGLTLTTPTIASFTNATHNHTNAAGGGQLAISAFSSSTGSGAVMGATSPIATNVTFNQAANNNDAITSLRFTDSSPTGNFLRFRNAANNADLFVVDVTGSITAGTVPSARLSGALPALDGSSLTSLNASNLASGTVNDGRLSANVTLLGNSTTGTGNIVRATSPTLTTPTLGVASATSITVGNTGLLASDTNASHTLNFKPGSDLTANRTLTFTTGDASRTLTINGDTTLSGTNTGDQTITLTSDVTGSGSGSFATTIANDAVTFAKMQNIATDRLIGRDTASSGDPEEIALAGSLVFTGSQTIQLSGDAGSPGNSKYYGTNGSGTKGFFDLPSGGGSLTVREVDASPSVSSVTTLEFAQGDGFVVTDQTGGVARVAITGIPWANVSKSGSSLADLTTRSAGDLSSGTLSNARLSASVPTSVVNDTNVTGSIASNALTLGWTGTLAKSRQHAATVYTDQVNTFAEVAQTIRQNSIDASSTDGLILTNNTAAAAGAQQISPRIRLTGQGWKTNATAASQTVDWAIENIPVQGAANPSTNLSFKAQINGGGYNEIASLTSGGTFTATLFSGSGASLTSLNASNLGSGTIPSARGQEVWALADLSDVSAKTGTGSTVVMQGSPSLTTPTIADFSNATHSHTNAAGGGTLSASAIASGTLSSGRLDTDVVLEGQANTWTTGAQDFGSATSLKVPTSGGAAPTSSGFVAYDSTSNVVKAGINGATVELSTWPVSVFVIDKPGASAEIIRFVPDRAMNLAAQTNSTDANARSDTAATGDDRDFLVQKASGGGSFSTVCTIRFDKDINSGTRAQYQSCSSTDFAAGDQLRILAPSTQDGGMTNVGITLTLKLK